MAKTIGLLFLLTTVFAGYCLPQNIKEHDKQSINNNYREFRRFFEDEIELTRQRAVDRQQPSILTIPETLPHWLSDIAGSHAGVQYVLGISDPGMDSIAGKRMAMQRAMLMYLLSNELQLINMRDLFSRDDGAQFSQTFIEYSEITADARRKSIIHEVVNTHITQYGETIVMLRIPGADPLTMHPPVPLYRVIATLYTQFKRHGKKMHIDEKMHLAMFFDDEDDRVQLDHHYVKISQLTNTRTYENDILISDMPALRLRYNDLPAMDSFVHEIHENSNDTGISMHNGLWHALLSGYIRVLADGCQEGSIHFSNVSDSFNQLNLSLSREFAGCKRQAGTPALRIVDNNLFLIFEDKGE